MRTTLTSFVCALLVCFAAEAQTKFTDNNIATAAPPSGTVILSNGAMSSAGSAHTMMRSDAVLTVTGTLGQGTGGTGAGALTCTNQFITSNGTAYSCATDVLASAQHANQGTTSQILIGNAAGNPSWGSVPAAANNVQTNATLTGAGTTGSNLGINLTNANTWTGAQTFTPSSAATSGITATGNTTGSGAAVAGGASTGAAQGGSGALGTGGAGSGAQPGGFGGVFNGGAAGTGIGGPGLQAQAANSVGTAIGAQGANFIGGNTAACSSGTCQIAGPGLTVQGGVAGAASSTAVGGRGGHAIVLTALTGNGSSSSSANAAGAGGDGINGIGGSGGVNSSSGLGGNGGWGINVQGGIAGSSTSGTGGNGGGGGQFQGNGGSSTTNGSGGVGVSAIGGSGSGTGSMGTAITATTTSGGTGAAAGYVLTMTQNGTVKAHLNENPLSADPSSLSNGDDWVSGATTAMTRKVRLNGVTQPFITFGANGAAATQTKRGVAGCTTAASIGATCSTTVTWTTAFPDANYTVTCNGFGGTGVPAFTNSNAKVAASISVVTTAITAVAASFSTIECTAIHD